MPGPIFDKAALALRSARMSVLGRAMRGDPEFPLTLEFPGSAERDRTEKTFIDRGTLERTLAEARVNAINDGLAIYTLPDGGFVLADKASAHPWRDYAMMPKRGWLGGVGRGWFPGAAARV